MRLLGALADSAVRTAAFAGAVGLALVVLRVTRPVVRLYAWTIVLYVSLALFMLGWAMPGLQVPLPAIALSTSVSPSAAPAPSFDDAVALRRAEPRATTARPAPATPRMEGSAVAEASRTRALSWSVVALSIYLAGVAILSISAGVGWVVTRRLERSARLIDDEVTLARAARHATASGLRRAPRLAASDRLFVPLATSVLWPMIVLPANWQEWGAAKLDAVLAHEIAHVARRDALTQRLLLVYRAVSWFNPFSWWLCHHLSDLAEQVSDEAALRAGVERTLYAETLLGFLAERTASPPGRADWNVAMVHGASAAEERVERILAWQGARSRRFSKALAVGILLAAAPAALLAAAVRPEIVNVRVVELPVVAGPSLGRPATLRFLPMPAVTSAPVIDRASVSTPAPVAPQAEPRQTSAGPAPTAPIFDASQDPLTRESIAGHGVWVLLFDLNSMAPWEAHRAVSAAIKWTDETMSSTDLVALLWVGSKLNVLRDFTNDKAKIQAALEGFAKDLPTTDTQGSNDTRLLSLKTVCDNLRNVQQHKAILYFSSGMQRGGTDQDERLRAAVASCQQSNTSINPVDARGLPGEIPPSQVPNGAAAGHTDPVMLSRTEPEYTPEALKAHIEGDVELEAVVLRDGTVGEVRVTKSLDKTDGLDDEAVRCARQWTFQPGGDYYYRATAVPVSLIVQFKMHGQAPGPAGPRPLADVFAKGAYQPDLTVSSDVGAQPVRQVDPRYTSDAMRAKVQADAARVVGPMLLTRVEAKSTTDATRDRVAGNVVLEAIVMPDGSVGKVRVVESLDQKYRYGLDDEAVKAVEQWLYRPAVLNGQPVPALVTLTVPFLPH